MKNQNTMKQTTRSMNARTKITRIFSSVLLGCSLSIALTAARPALAQVSESITFDDLGLSVLDAVTTQYASKGVVFQGFDDFGFAVSLDVADSTLYTDVNPPSLPFVLSTFYGHDDNSRANIMEIQFPGTVGTVSGISFLFNGEGYLGADVVFNVYNTSSVLVDSFTVPAASDSSYHLVSISDANVGKIDLVAPEPGWAFYIDNLQYTLNSTPPPSSAPAVPMALSFTLSGTMQNPIPAPNAGGSVRATTTSVRLTSASLLQLAASAHGTHYPGGALISVTLLGQGEGSIDPVAVMDRTGTNMLDDISDLLLVVEKDNGMQSVSGQWVINSSSQYMSEIATGYEVLEFMFDNGVGTSFDFSAPAKISCNLGKPDRKGNQKMTQSLTLTAGGEGTAINLHDSGSFDRAIWTGTVSASGTHLLNQNP